MKEIVAEYGTAILAAAGGTAIIGCIGYAFINSGGAVSLLFGRLIALYL